MMQKMPMVIPNKERKVRSLFFHSSCKAILKLVKIISNVRRIIHQNYKKAFSVERIYLSDPTALTQMIVPCDAPFRVLSVIEQIVQGLSFYSPSFFITLIFPLLSI